MGVCMVCGVERTASYITGEPSCSCMSPAAFQKFMELHGERDQLRSELDALHAALIVSGRPYVGLTVFQWAVSVGLITAPEGSDDLPGVSRR